MSKEPQQEMDQQHCEKCDEYVAGWKRALADYDNVVKDLDRARGEMRQNAKRDAVEMLLPVLDNFDQALKFKPEGLDTNAENWLSGILHVQTQLEQVLSEFGAAPFGVIGDSFDPNLHEAVEEQVEKEKGDGEILGVAARGWKLGEQLIRPAKVIVNSVK